jgi:hypothetical protein
MVEAGWLGADLIHRKSTDEQEDAADTYHGAPDRP